mgnify:FL=1
MSPLESIIAAQQFAPQQRPLQPPSLGLLSVPDMSYSYTDMSVSDEEIRKRLKLGPTDKITPEIRMHEAAQRLQEIPGNMMSVPGNVMEAGKSAGSGLLDLFR